MLGALRVVHITKSPILLERIGGWKISSVTYGFSSIKMDYFDNLKSSISRIYRNYVYSIKYRYSDILLNKT